MFTEQGKRGIDIAKETGLFEYYDPYTGFYRIPEEKATELEAKIERLKEHGYKVKRCFLLDENGVIHSNQYELCLGLAEDLEELEKGV